MAARAIDAIDAALRGRAARRARRGGADLLELDLEALFDEAGGPCAGRTERSLAGLLVHLLPFADMDKTAIYGLWRCLNANAGPRTLSALTESSAGRPLS